MKYFSLILSFMIVFGTSNVQARSVRSKSNVSLKISRPIKASKTSFTTTYTPPPKDQGPTVANKVESQ